MMNIIAFIFTDFSNWFCGILSGFFSFPVAEAEGLVRYDEYLGNILAFREFIVTNYKPEESRLLVGCIDQSVIKIQTGTIRDSELTRLMGMIEIWTASMSSPNYSDEFFVFLMNDVHFRTAMMNYITSDTIFQMDFLKQSVQTSLNDNIDDHSIILLTNYTSEALCHTVSDLMSDKILQNDKFVNMLADKVADKVMNDDKYLDLVVDKVMNDEQYSSILADKMVSRLVEDSINHPSN